MSAAWYVQSSYLDFEGIHDVQLTPMQFLSISAPVPPTLFSANALLDAQQQCMSNVQSAHALH